MWKKQVEEKSVKVGLSRGDVLCSVKEEGGSKEMWKKQVEEKSVKVGLSRGDVLCSVMWIVGINQIVTRFT